MVKEDLALVENLISFKSCFCDWLSAAMPDCLLSSGKAICVIYAGPLGAREDSLFLYLWPGEDSSGYTEVTVFTRSTEDMWKGNWGGSKVLYCGEGRCLKVVLGMAWP